MKPNGSRDQAAQSPRSGTAHANRQAVEKIIRHMRSNLSAWEEDLSLDALARESCYSKPQLNRIFKAITGITPHHFLASLRIERAKKLILTTDYSITSIAYEVGYESFPSFSRTFRALVAVSPGAFRRMRAPAAATIGTSPPGTNQAYLSACEVSGRIVCQSGNEGMIFVGIFEKGIPQGMPFSGTVMHGAGGFRLPVPDDRPCHLLAALVSHQDILHPGVRPVRPPMVGSQRLQPAEDRWIELSLRPILMTDPPLVAHLPRFLDHAGSQASPDPPAAHLALTPPE